MVAREDQYHKFLNAQYWQSEEKKWVEFLYMNPVVVTVAYMGGYQSVFLDIIFLYFVPIVFIMF